MAANCLPSIIEFSSSNDQAMRVLHALTFVVDPPVGPQVLAPASDEPGAASLRKIKRRNISSAVPPAVSSLFAAHEFIYAANSHTYYY